MMRKMGKSMCLLLALLILMGVLLVSCGEAATPTDEPASSDGNDSPTTTEPTGEVVINSMKKTYETALSCLEQGKIEEAYALFLSIPDYRDVSEHLARFVYRYGREVVHSKYKSSLFEYHYNQYGQQTEQIEESNILRRIYDDKGNCLRVFYQNGSALYYTYDEQGKIVRQEHYQASLGKVTYDTYSYDEQGHMIERCYYDEPDTLSMRYTYTYDEVGNRTEMVVFFGDVERYRYEYTYDEAGNPLSKKYTASDVWSLTEYEYNDQNLLVREKSSSSSGYAKDKSQEYDAKGNIIRVEYKYPDSEPTIYEYTNEYDDEGRLIKITTVIDSEIFNVKTYEYDENGNVIRDTLHEYTSGTINYYCIYDYLDYQLYYDPFIGRVDPLADMDFGGK